MLTRRKIPRLVLTKPNFIVGNYCNQYQDNISNLSQQVSTLTQIVQKQNEALEKNKITPRKIVQAHKTPKVYGPRIRFTIRAMFPGRAWLVDNQGNNLNVAVGDKLPGYGKVV